MAGSQEEPSLAHADADLARDFELAVANRVALSFGHGRILPAVVLDDLEEHAGERGEISSPLMGSQGGRRGAVGTPLPMRWLDDLVPIAVRAIEFFVEPTSSVFFPREAGDDPALVAFARQPLGFADHSARPGPGIQGAILETAEPPRGLAGVGTSSLRTAPWLGDSPTQARIFTEAKKIIDMVVFTPGHEGFPTESRITPQNDPCPLPAPASRGDHSGNFLERPDRRIGIRPAPSRTQHLTMAGDLDGQITIIPIITMIKPSFRFARQRNIRRLDIPDEIFGFRRMRGLKTVHQQLIQLRRINRALLIAIGRRIFPTPFESIKSAVPGQGTSLVSLATPVLARHVLHANR